MNYLKDFVLAANYAGIAFGNAGCGAIHALSYPSAARFMCLTAKQNYQFLPPCSSFTQRIQTENREVQSILADILGCDPKGDVYGELEKFLTS